MRSSALSDLVRSREQRDLIRKRSFLHVEHESLHQYELSDALTKKYTTVFSPPNPPERRLGGSRLPHAEGASRLTAAQWVLSQGIKPVTIYFP